MCNNNSENCLKCNAHCQLSSLKCSDCKMRVHYKCSELPIYFIIMLEHTQRKFTCFQCAKKISLKYDEHFEAIAVEIANDIQDKELEKYQKTTDRENISKGISDTEPSVTVNGLLINGMDSPTEIAEKKASDTLQLAMTGNPKNSRKSSTISNEDVKTRPVCKYYLTGSCKHGKLGSNCRFQHPKFCPEFLTDGNGLYGCRAKNCGYFHPKICRLLELQTMPK